MWHFSSCLSFFSLCFYSNVWEFVGYLLRFLLIFKLWWMEKWSKCKWAGKWLYGSQNNNFKVHLSHRKNFFFGFVICIRIFLFKVWKYVWYSYAYIHVNVKRDCCSFFFWFLYCQFVSFLCYMFHWHQYTIKSFMVSKFPCRGHHFN